MTTTSAAIARGGGHAPRTSINGLQWTEAEISRGGGRAPGALIGSKDQVLNVKSWDPAQDDEEVLHSQPVQANLEALNSNELEVLYDEGIDFLTGVLDDCKVEGDAVKLATDLTEIDFENYTLFNALANGANPDSWTRLDQKADSNTSIRVDPDDAENQVVRGQVYNSVLSHRNDDLGTPRNGIITCRFYIPDSNDSKAHGIFFRTTGAGGGMLGHMLSFREDDPFVRFDRIYDWDSHFTVRSHNLGYEPGPDKWIWFKVIFYGDVDVRCSFKIWDDGDPEPEAWTWGGNDTWYWDVDGYVGLQTWHNTSTNNKYMDDFSFEDSPSTYLASGNWESGIIDLTSVDHYSHALVSWDEIIPADTTLALKVRWPGGSWIALTNDAILPSIPYEQDMRAGSTKNSFELRIEMATTDDSATPEVENLRVYFEPLRVDEMEMTVHGTVCVPADASLAHWGRAWIGASGVPATIAADWSDIWVESRAWWLARDLQTVAAALEYWGNAIDSITFETEESKYRHGYLTSYFSIPLTPFYSGPNIFEYTTLTEWDANGKDYEWVLTDKGLAIHADAKFIVGHPQRDDHPLSLLIAVPNLTNHPLSVQVKGYQRDDHKLSMLIQGWQRDDFPLSALVGEWTVNDQPVSMLVGIEYLNTQPLSILVYGVSREGMIEVNVIDADTWAELVALGFTRS